jgi:hypothetical protein
LTEGLDRLAPAGAEARRLAELPRGRYTIEYRSGYLATRLPHLQPAREVSFLMLADAVRAAERGGCDGGLVSCRAALNAGRSIGDEPFAVSQLVRTACVSRSLTAVEWVLGQGEAREETLAALQRLLEEEAAHPAFLIVARGERGGVHSTLEAIESGTPGY